MKFKNDEERMQQPQGRLIPQDVWEHFFWGELPDKCISLMTAGKDALLHGVDKILYKNDQEKCHAWLAIAFSHPDLSTAMLRELSQAMHLPDINALKTAIAYGRLDYARKLYEELTHHLDPKSRGCESNRQALFLDAAKFGHLDILLYLESCAPDKLQEMIASDVYAAFRYAAKNGHLDTLQYLEARAPDKLQGMIAKWDCHAFKEAAKYEHHDVVSYLLAHSTAFSYAEQHDHEYGEKYVHPFIANKLSTLHAQKAAVEQENPNAVFDIRLAYEI